MADKQRPGGRGALLATLQKTKSGPETHEYPPPFEPTPSTSKGRGAILEALRKAKEISMAEETERPRGRGRAALIAKLREMKIGSSPKKIPEAGAPVETYTEKKDSALKSVVSFRGTSGSEIHITANYVRLSFTEKKGVFEYEVKFHSVVDSKNLRIKILNSIRDELGNIKTYDGGSCLYLPIKLPSDATDFTCKHPVNDSEINVSVIYKKQKQLGDCIHFFNTLFKRIMRALQLVTFNRNYFDVKRAMFVPHYKLEILPGYVVAVDEYEGGLMLCMDVSHRILRTQTVYDLMIEMKRSEKFKEEMQNLLLGMTVLTRYNNKTYVIHDIMWNGSPSDTFTSHEGREISYVEYYRSHYNIIIKDTNQPLLLNKKIKRLPGVANVEEFLVCLIPELCHVTGLTDQMRADFRVMKDVAQHTRISPSQRIHALKGYLKRVNECPEAKKILNDWGLRLDDCMIDLNARVLDSERIFFGANASAQTDYKVDWTNALIRNSLLGPVDLINWTIIYLKKDTNLVKQFIDGMVEMGRPMGCTINHPRLWPIENDRSKTLITALNQVINPEVQCVVVLLQGQRLDLYTTIKKICCVESPVASQVILSKTLSNPKRIRSVIQKIAYQITCKLGGSLWSLKFPITTWMVIGIDVYHSPGMNHSWLGFVSSLNQNFTRWYSIATKQMKEVSDYLKVSFSRALEQFYEIRGTHPTHVIIFRDGVSDGQMEHVREYELRQFEECARYFNLNIEFCMIVVQKRINTRLFLQNKDEQSNPVSGTILDHSVTKKCYKDFYMISQHVSQGTVTPTHYVVLHNSANIKADILQKLSYKMTHLYYNWSGTIRVPAPCQYAHKLAYLVGQYIKTVPSDSLNNRLYYL